MPFCTTLLHSTHHRNRLLVHTSYPVTLPAHYSLSSHLLYQSDFIALQCLCSSNLYVTCTMYKRSDADWHLGCKSCIVLSFTDTVKVLNKERKNKVKQ